MIDSIDGTVCHNFLEIESASSTEMLSVVNILIPFRALIIILGIPIQQFKELIITAGCLFIINS